MSVKYTSKTLVSSASSIVGTWIPLDYKFKSIQQRSLIAIQDSNSVSAADVVKIYVTPDDFISISSISTSVLVTSFTTASYAGILNGPWTAIKAEKTGSGGTVVVKLVG